MPHASNIVHCDGPDSPHAFDIIPLRPRNGSLDARCPICHGHGQWNTEIDLVSFRCKRAICDHCYGAGWVETGDDPIGFPDIVTTPEGYPKWIVRYVVKSDVESSDPKSALLAVPKP
ncbi:hypothetical protein [Sphingomonas oligophenolica]|uniref:Uncharacterized protein n=1 Tax=Sphingomonas oligophenolica TaxID=301154 RepID=A0A502CN55_9SPHN|nr:hypothetical protein [Sphingomonas oligophenolica]TPG13206.1 hypothetical protein EAH84_07350 [Sphingomonas oligophenolica]